MKKILIICIIITISISVLKAQKRYTDTIITVSGKTIECKIFEINEIKVTYYYPIKENSTAISEISMDSIKSFKCSNEIFMEIYSNIQKNKEKINASKINSDKVDYIIVDTLQFLYQTVINMKNLRHDFHAQYRTGTTLIITGGLVSALGGAIFAINILNTNNYKQPNNTFPVVLINIGGVLSMVGSIVQIDSHKYFNNTKFGINKFGATVSIPIQ